jgi:hypothetical protein
MQGVDSPWPWPVGVDLRPRVAAQQRRGSIRLGKSVNERFGIFQVGHVPRIVVIVILKELINRADIKSAGLHFVLEGSEKFDT